MPRNGSLTGFSRKRSSFVTASLNAAVLVRAASRIASDAQADTVDARFVMALVGRRKGEEAPRRGEGGESAEG